MDVHLLVYDLSNGLAKQLSFGLLGFQLDAIYHTSIELDGMEYVYDGGINVIKPGSSHLGPPLERIHLGKSELPMEIILEYLESLKEIYTPQAYDLFRHNCNNFSNDFSTFLVGKGIPDHIANMPQSVLDSPFGRMMQPQLARMVEERKAQQGGLLGIQNNVQPHTNGAASATTPQNKSNSTASVRVITSLSELNQVLDASQKSCAIIFFTMANCGPCRALYPLYDSLAQEYQNKVTLIKVDIHQAFDVASKYNITATPTFITFLHGKEEERFTGADAAKLRGTVGLLAQMAIPSHPHQLLRLNHSMWLDSKPVIYGKVVPIPKLLAKLGSKADDESIQGMIRFIETKESQGPALAHLPDLSAFSSFMRSAVKDLPKEVLFTVVDLFRCTLADTRVSGYFAEEHGHETVLAIVDAVNKDTESPYALRLVTLQMASNLFSSHLYADQILGNPQLRSAITQLVSSSFLDDKHSTIRVAASSLLFNVASANLKKRLESGDILPEEDQVELAASLLEAISQEESSKEALDGMLLALGLMTYCLPLEGELIDLLRSMDAQGTVLAKEKLFKTDLTRDVGQVLLGKGLARK
ncbi:DUF862-domain-containing protein [Annulohypoxylon truncatum]|uniref:DUF862-domain-containing protein n=1 Tax=Annulohypoxylon truncatum TaxID=327061 RepID=UPI00200766C3|nr:DUF862-domain-containing protein [Annulohypoxylon truncatum]KAI1214594.1 DUF862-domain-containing protein [Annulohypoxylon truncatum]